MCAIINFWRELDINNGQELIHPQDLQILENVNRINLNFNNYVGNCDNLFGDNYQLHTGLIPVPYAGDIRRARIYLLMLNPGFHPNDYYSENYCENYRNALIQTLRQENINNAFPFHYLNPEFIHTSGGEYWFNKFRDIIIQFSSELNLPYDISISFISQNICALELFPYHSINFQINQNIINECPSINMIRGFVNNLLENRENILIECLRQPENWNLNGINDERLHILPPALRQNVSFRTYSELGQRIYQKLVEIYNDND